jgi:hypothetical protein
MKSISITAGGRKGEFPKALRAKVTETAAAARARGEEQLATLAEAIGTSVNKIVPRAPKGAIVQMQASVELDERGCWSASVLLDVSGTPVRGGS